MVKKASARKRKYEGSMDPDVIGGRFEALKPSMVEQEKEYFAQIAEVERKVKRICEAAGVPSYQIAQYINVGRQCYSLNKRFGGQTRDAEAQALMNHWRDRGLNNTILVKACVAGGCDPEDPGLPPGFQELEDKLDAMASIDETDSFTWDTGAFGIVEQDISALFVTPLTGTSRRKYAVYLDLTGPAADAAAWTTCTVKVKLRIDGVNYRTIDKKELAKGDVAAAEEPGIPIDIPPVAQDVQVTLQFDVALNSNQDIPYHYVRTRKE